MPDTQFLNSLLPDYWWFRTAHFMIADKMRVNGTILISEDQDPADIVGYFNGEEVEVSAPTQDNYADRAFWFAPQHRRFGLSFDAPISAGARSTTSCFAPRGIDTSTLVSGQFVDWKSLSPTPPVGNIERVSGKGATAYNYYNNGLTDYLRFTNVARAHGVEVSDPDTRVLDWGCGCGRLTRLLLDGAGNRENVKGVDIDPDNIAWSAKHLSETAFSTVGLYPPTHFDDESFDLIIANSVLSHLKYQPTLDWIAEVARLLRPGGVALLSYHGDFSTAAVTSNNIDFARRVNTEGFNCDLPAGELEGLVSDNEYYRQTFMSDAKAAELFGTSLTLKEVHKGIVSRYQNVAVLTK